MTSAALSQAYQAARTHAALFDRRRGRIVVSGRDRATYLQGLLTNDIPAVKEGQGCYAAYLTPQGRLISDLLVYELGDVLLLSLPLATKDVVLAKLDQFIFSEDVQLGDVTETFAGVVVVGPDAALAVHALTGTDVGTLAALPIHGNLRATVNGEPVIVLRVDDTGEPGFELLVPAATANDVRAQLVQAGTVEADEATAEQLRIEAGVPRFGQDMDEETIPLEAGIEARVRYSNEAGKRRLVEPINRRAEDRDFPAAACRGRAASPPVNAFAARRLNVFAATVVRDGGLSCLSATRSHAPNGVLLCASTTVTACTTR